MLKYTIREAKEGEYQVLGKLIAITYSNLEGFPKLTENPQYYETFRNLKKLSEKSETKVLIAVSNTEEILGGLVFYGHAIDYGSGVIDTNFQAASGIRLLAVSPQARNKGIAKALTHNCFKRVLRLNHDTLILHSTKSMQVAWSMYEKLGFQRFEKIDFELNGMAIYGFKKQFVIP